MSVTNTTELQKIKPLLDKHLKNAKWNFDLEDCDNILRIDSSEVVAKTTIKLLQENGFECQELED